MDKEPLSPLDETFFSRENSSSDAQNLKNLSSGVGSEFDESSIRLYEIIRRQVNNAFRDASNVREEVAKLSGEVYKVKNDLSAQQTKNIEMLALFAAVLAILIGTFTFVTRTTDFLYSIGLLIATSAVVSLLLLQVHYFFVDEGRQKSIKWLLVPSVLLVLLVIIAFVPNLKNYSIEFKELKTSPLEEKSH